MHRFFALLFALACSGCGGAAGDAGQPIPAPPTYHIVDVGTLGGTWTLPGGINASGQVTGTSELPDGTWQAFIWEDGIMEGLGTLGASTSWGNAINDAGQVTGSSAFADECTEPDVRPCGPESFLWNGTEMVARERTPHDEALFSEGYAVNRSGQVLGQGWDDMALTAFVWDGASTTWIMDHNLRNGFRTMGNAFNDQGQVVGVFDLTATELAFIWDPATSQMSELGTFGGFMSAANEINSAGHVVGYANTEFDRGEMLAFVWFGAALVNLGTLGGTHSSALLINDADYVAGVSQVPGDNARHAFLWHDSALEDLGTLGGSESFPLAMNSAAEVVGYSRTNGDEHVHAFVWDGASMKDLNSLVSSLRLDGARLSRAEDINDNGQILVSGMSADGHERVFVLTPITALLDALLEYVATIEPGGFAFDIASARSYFEAHDVRAACSMLEGVGQRGGTLPARSISASKARQIDETSSAIQAALEC